MYSLVILFVTLTNIQPVSIDGFSSEASCQQAIATFKPMFDVMTANTNNRAMTYCVNKG